jgi:hypothetical protein
MLAHQTIVPIKDAVAIPANEALVDGRPKLNIKRVSIAWVQLWSRRLVNVTRQLTFIVATLLHSNDMTIMHGVLR